MPTPVSGVKPSNPDRWLTIDGKPLSFAPGDENLGVDAHEYRTSTIRITAAAPDDLKIEIDGQALETERYGRWLWDPHGYAGVYQLRVSATGHPDHEASVRVQPTRLTHDRYVRMLADIAAIATDLLLELHSPAMERASAVPQTTDRPAALRDYELMQRIAAALPDVLSAIERRPQRQLAQVGESRLLQEIGEFSAETLPSSAVLTAVPAWTGLRMSALPLHWTVQRRVLTFDVPENRLIRHFLTRQFLPRLNSVRHRAGSEITRRSVDLKQEEANGWTDSADETRRTIAAIEVAVRNCAHMATQAARWADAGYLRDLGALSHEQRPTQLLQKHPYYSRFYRLYLDFQNKLRISLNTESYTTMLGVRKVWELYQIWSALILSRIVQHYLTQGGFALVGQEKVFRKTEEEFHLEFEGGASIELEKGDVRVKLRYEPVYPSDRKAGVGFIAMSPGQLTPDITLEIWRAGKQDSMLVFDAKYRGDRVGSSDEVTYKAEDWETAAKYSRLIGTRRNATERGRACVASSYLLYPGDVFEHNRTYSEIGVISLYPGQPEAERHQAVRIIVDLLQNAKLI